MVAESDGMTLPCLRVQGAFCQGLILHTMPNDCLYSCTCLRQYPIPSKEPKKNYGGYFPLSRQIDHEHLYSITSQTLLPFSTTSETTSVILYYFRQPYIISFDKYLILLKA